MYVCIYVYIHTYIYTLYTIATSENPSVVNTIYMYVYIYIYCIYAYMYSSKFKKYNSNKCILANSFFKPTDKIVSSVTDRTYS